MRARAEPTRPDRRASDPVAERRARVRQRQPLRSAATGPARRGAAPQPDGHEPALPASLLTRLTTPDVPAPQARTGQSAASLPPTGPPDAGSKQLRTSPPSGQARQLRGHAPRPTSAMAWGDVLAEDEPIALPGRTDLERRFGRSLADVEVRAGSRARDLLAQLGARAATAGRVVLLRDPGDQRDVAHEVVHVLQRPRPARLASGPVTVPVVPASHPAEREAERLARRHRGRPRVSLPIGTIALRRDRVLRPLEQPPGPAVDDQDLPPAPAIVTRRRRPSARAPPRAERPAPSEDGSPDPAPATDQVPDEADDERTAGARESRTPAPEVTPATEDSGDGDGRDQDGSREGDEVARSGTTPEAVPGAATAAGDRRREVDRVLDDTQQAWDDGSGMARGHAMEPCDDLGTAAGRSPFARGPPAPVPATRPVPVLPEATTRSVDTGPLDRARSAVDRQLARAPPGRGPDRATGLDPDERAERDQGRRRVGRTIARQIARAPGAAATPTVARTGRADPRRIEQAEGRTAAAVEQASTRARDRAREDQGEDRLGPRNDPTVGHDTALADAGLPALDVTAQIDATRLDRIATAGNVGRVPLDDVVLVRDDEVAAARQQAQDRTRERERIDVAIRRGETDLDRTCRAGTAERDRDQRTVVANVTERRRNWTRAVDDQVADRRAEATRLGATARRRTDAIAEDAADRAGRTIREANDRADKKWQETRDRAETKTHQASEDRGWFQRGLDWLRDKLKGLVAWIDAFIDACRRVVDALLVAARQVAHAIVDAAHRAMTEVLDGLHTAVDAIADNLPGELGKIARRHRDDLHAALDRAQDRLDAWADDAHASIDRTVDGVRDTVHGALDDLQDGVHDIADAVDDFLANGLMAFLRAHFPLLASLLDEGLSGPVDRAARMLEGWATDVVDATGLGSLAGTLDELVSGRFCETATPAEQADRCDALQRSLDAARGWIDDLLASPIAQRIQGLLERHAQAQADQQADAASGFFTFIAAVARPVHDWWLTIEPVVRSALDELGAIATAVWRHVATALGIDPDLSPLEALTQGLEAAWTAISDLVRPLVDQVRQAWDWIRHRSPLAPVLDFFASLPQLWEALTAAASTFAGNLWDWLVDNGRALAERLLAPVQAAANLVADVVDRVIGVVATAIDGLLGVLDLLMAWEPGLALLAAVALAVRALLAPARTALQLFRACAIPAWRALTGMLRDLGRLVRTIIDLAVGVTFAIVGFPGTTVLFLAGRVWQHLVPECAKGPLLDFFLDLGIRFLRFLPEPGDFGLVIVRSGLLGFLEGLRAAPTAQKVGAVDLFARMVGGDAEIAAGFAVGLLEGVWESTGGTIVFLLQAAAWLMALPFRLAGWAAQQLGQLVAPGGSVTTGASRHPGTAPRRPITASASTTAGTLEPSAVPDDPVATTEPVTTGAPRGPPVDQPADGPGPSSDDREPSDDELERLAGRNLPPAAERGVAPTADESELAREDPIAESPAAADVAEPIGSHDAPPPVPAAVAGAQGLLQRLLTTGFTREEVLGALQQLRAMLRGSVSGLARQAAGLLLGALNAPGAGFAIARTMGSLVGQLVVEIVLAALTGGASGLVTAAKAALQGARLTARLGSVLARLRRVLEPVLSALARFKRVLGELASGVRRWLDDVLEWMRGIVRRATGRRPGPLRPHGPVRAHGPSPARPRPGRAGDRPPQRPDHPGSGPGDRRPARPHDRDGPDRHRDRDDDKRARLRRVVARLKPALRREVGRNGLSERLLGLRLRFWQLRYGLTSLRARDLGNTVRIVARLNPTAPVDELSELDPDHSEDIARHLRRELQRLMNTAPIATEARSVTSSGWTRPPTPQESSEMRSIVGRDRWRQQSYNAPATAATEGVRAYDVPAGTTELGMAAAFRRFRRRTGRRGAGLTDDQSAGLMRVFNFAGPGAPRVYARQPAGGPTGRFEQEILAVVQRASVTPSAAGLPYPGRPHEAGIAGDVLRGAAGVPAGRANEAAAIATVMFGMEPVRSQAAVGHALLVADVEAFSRANPGSQARRSHDDLFGTRSTTARGRPINLPGTAPFTGTGRAQAMRTLDAALGETGDRTRTRRLGAAQRRQLTSEMVMIDVWLRTQGDFVFTSFADRAEQVREIKQRITDRLERAAGLR